MYRTKKSDQEMLYERILYLLFTEEKTHKEIQEILNISPEIIQKAIEWLDE